MKNPCPGSDEVIPGGHWAVRATTCRHCRQPIAVMFHEITKAQWWAKPQHERGPISGGRYYELRYMVHGPV